MSDKDTRDFLLAANLLCGEIYRLREGIHAMAEVVAKHLPEEIDNNHWLVILLDDLDKLLNNVTAGDLIESIRAATKELS